jgi:hypothetical protein
MSSSSEGRKKPVVCVQHFDRGVVDGLALFRLINNRWEASGKKPLSNDTGYGCLLTLTRAALHLRYLVRCYILQRILARVLGVRIPLSPPNYSFMPLGII